MGDISQRIWDALDAYMFPPSPEEKLRRARAKLANRARAAERKAVAAERAEAASMKQLRASAHTADEAALRILALDTKRKMGVTKRMRDICRMINSAEGRVTSAETATAVRDIMRDTVGALGDVVAGGAAAVAVEAHGLQKQLFHVDMLTDAMDEAMGEEDELDESDDLVNDLLDQVRESEADRMPRPPDGPALMAAEEAAIIARIEERRSNNRL